jgi:hypothetical protein
VEVEFGIYRSPEEWHHEATCVPHPFDNRSFLREWQLAALKAILESQRHDTASHCIQFINKYTKRRDELLEAESLLHGRMEPRIREIMRRKNILLFLEVLAYAGISDSLIGKQLQEGFPISGELGSSHLFDQEKRDASITKEYLMRDTGWRAKATYANARPHQDESPIITAEIYSDTLIGKDKGWARGPITVEDLDATFPRGGVHGLLAASIRALPTTKLASRFPMFASSTTSPSTAQTKTLPRMCAWTWAESTSWLALQWP